MNLKNATEHSIGTKVYEIQHQTNKWNSNSNISVMTSRIRNFQIFLAVKLLCLPFHSLLNYIVPLLINSERV
jgi:hypothetical protein